MRSDNTRRSNNGKADPCSPHEADRQSDGASSSGFVSITITDDILTTASSGSTEPPAHELLRSVATFELLELALSRRDVTAARRANERIKALGSRHNIAEHPERLTELKSLMRARGFADSKMEELQVRFQELDRTGKITRESWKGKNCGLEDDPLLLETVSLFARLELALLRQDLEQSVKIKKRIAQLGSKHNLERLPSRVQELKTCLNSRGFTQSKLDEMDRSLSSLLAARNPRSPQSI